MKPKMIIFDAGRTLLDYREINILKGKEALIGKAQGTTDYAALAIFCR